MRSTVADDVTNDLERTEELAAALRVRSIRMAERAGSGHPTSAMSAADLVACLVARHLRLDVGRPDDPGNDRILFSKGHASPLLYAALDAIGVLDGALGRFTDVVEAYRQAGSVLEGHPTPRIPGVSAATGSLGLGLAIGAGLAVANRLAGDAGAHVWVLCGDSELAEGSIWEAVEHAGSAPVTGLTALVDVNRLGQTGPTRHEWDLDAYRHRFEAFGWAAIEIDGHDLHEIDDALATARDADRPTAVIARTEKGHGATETSDELGKHGKPLDDPDRAVAELGGDRRVRITPRAARLADRPAQGDRAPDLPSWHVGDEVATRDAFGDALVALAAVRPDLVAIDGEVGDSTRLQRFADVRPEHFVQAYIAEQLMAGMAIGLDAGGWRPVMATFGAFLTRAHDVLRMAAISRSQLLVVGTHAGVSIGADGPSQMALEDLAMMRCLAGSTVVSASDANQAAALLAQLVDRPGISYLRLLRGATPVVHSPGTEFPIGGSVRLRAHDDPDVVILATGSTVAEAIEASDRLARSDVAADVVDVYSIKPIDTDAITRSAAADHLVVAEDHRPEGGLGDAVREAITACDGELTHLAVNGIPGSATPDEQRARARIDAEAIVSAVLAHR